MLTKTRNLGIFSAIICLYSASSLTLGQEFLPPPSQESTRLESTDNSREHSILDSGPTANHSPSLEQTFTRQQGNPPIVDSSMIQDPFSSPSGIQRVAGTGEDASGTFATSQHMPTQGSRLPVLSNGLRGSGPPQGSGNTGFRDAGTQNLNSQSSLQSTPSAAVNFRDRPSPGGPFAATLNDSSFDGQPTPPQPSQSPPMQRSFGQRTEATPRLARQTPNPYSNNRFQGPSQAAPPIHNPPSIASQDPTPSMQPMIQDSQITPTQYQRSVQHLSLIHI